MVQALPTDFELLRIQGHLTVTKFQLRTMPFEVKESVVINSIADLKWYDFLTIHPESTILLLFCTR